MIETEERPRETTQYEEFYQRLCPDNTFGGTSLTVDWLRVILTLKAILSGKLCYCRRLSFNRLHSVLYTKKEYCTKYM